MNQNPDFMKRLFISLILLMSTQVYSQITLDFQTSSLMFYFKLNNTETKYFNYDISLINSTHQLLLYNLDGSLYKTLQLPSIPNSVVVRIDWISESLFDNNPSNIEYLAFCSEDSASFQQYHARVIREDGSILLDEINASPEYWIGWRYWDPLVYFSEDGPKLMLEYTYAQGAYYQTKVFSLPGVLPNDVKEEMVIRNRNLSIYPNPNNGSFFIDLHSSNENSHTIDLYSSSGKLIDTYESSGNPTHIYNFGLSEGIYLINTQSKGMNSTFKMIIKK
jgi:Secretion system C-terminal sorting domain